MTKKQGEIVIFVTTNSADEAHSIANLLLNQRKVACVNIIHCVDSLFW